MIANCDIDPHEVLFGDYGKSFFLQFKGDFHALNHDGSIAPAHIQNKINQMLHQYIAQRNSSNVSNIMLKSILEKIDQAQLDNKQYDYPRVFLNKHIFIVYPDAYNDLLKLAEAFLLENDPNIVGASSTLSFLKKLNIQYNKNNPSIENQIKVLEHKLMNEQLTIANSGIKDLHNDLKIYFTENFLNNTHPFWKSEHPIDELREKILNNTNTADDYSQIITLSNKDRASKRGRMVIEKATACMNSAKKIEELQGKLNAEKEYSHSLK
jgi:hypothetical protein